MKIKTIYTVVMFLLALLMLGCRKEQGINDQNRILPKSNIKIEGLIKSFKTRLSTNLKTTDSIPVDSLEWYLGATANYSYGDATARGLHLSIDSAFLTLELHGNYILIEYIEEIYDALVDSVRSHYYSIDNNYRYTLAIIVRTVSQTSQQIDFKITSLILYGPTNNFWDFDENDQWWWWDGGTGNGGGYCGGQYQGTALGTDAADMIQQRMLFRKPIPSGTYCYIPPYATVYLDPQEYFNPNSPPSFNYYHYFMYYNSSEYPDFHGCLCPDEMNFYLTGTEHVVYTANNAAYIPGARPPDLSFMTILLEGDGLFPGSVSVYLHHGYAYYGTLLVTGGLPDNL